MTRTANAPRYRNWNVSRAVGAGCLEREFQWSSTENSNCCLSLLYMIDTDTVSYLVKSNSPVARRTLVSLQSGEIACISAITEGEI